MAWSTAQSASLRLIRMLLAVALVFTGALTAHAQDTEWGHVVVPALGISTAIVTAPVVLPTWDVSQLGARAGWLEMTGWFGQPGNAVLAGHSTTPDLQPSTWYNLHNLSAGDEVIVTVGGVELRYAVAGVYRVRDTDMSLVLPTQHEQLTLMTCAVDSWNGYTFTERIMVVTFPVR